MSKKTFFAVLLPLLLFRIYLGFNLGFADDESYHWTWAKNINYSYFDHPGMVAWMIWPFIQVFGDVEWAIRMPAFFMYLGILYFTYRLGKELFGELVGMCSSLLLLFIPLWGFASLGTLPDMPLTFFWLLVVWTFWQSVKPENPWTVKKTWLLIGVFMGLGMNSKLTICLSGLGMGLYLLLSQKHRKHLLTPWPYLGAVITFVIMTPVFVWNAKNDWASFHYQFLSRHREAQGADWNRWLQFWGYQWIFMGIAVYALIVASFIKGILNWKDDRWRLMFALTAPSLALFYYQPLMSAYKPHWSGPSYLILLFGAVAILTQMSGWKKKITIALLVLFLIPFQLLYIPMLTPIVPRVFARLNPGETWVPKNDFSNEFYGWKDLGRELVQRQQKIAQETGKRPHLGGQRYELIAQIWWGAKQKVWQLSYDRDQFKYDQPESDKLKLRGEDFLIVNNDKYPENPTRIAHFDSCDMSEFPFYRKDSQGEVLARTFYIYYCKNYQGLK